MGGEPCPACRIPRWDEVGEACWACRLEKKFGAALATGRDWYFGPGVAGSESIAHWHLAVAPPRQAVDHRTIFQGAQLSPPVPTRDFGEIAEKSPGRPLLAYLKADGDRMGELLQSLSLERRLELSQAADGVFHTTLGEFTSAHGYVVYGGGDDLFCAAPWPVALTAAVKLREAWQQALRPFREQAGLSCGIAVYDAGYPLAYALEAAEEALVRAKLHRNRLYVLGESLTWEQVGELNAAWPELAAFLKADTGQGRELSVSLLRGLLRHLPASPDPDDLQHAAAVRAARDEGVDLEDSEALTRWQHRRRWEEFVRGRAMLLYSLKRNLPLPEYAWVWRWLVDWIPFRRVPEPERAVHGRRLQVLRVAVQLALWSTRPRDEDSQGGAA
jgi:hypothetical protein